MRNKRKLAGILLIVAILVGWIIYVIIAAQSTPYGDSQIQTVETIVILREDIVSTGSATAYYITAEGGKEYRTSEDVFYRLGRGKRTVITTKRNGEDFILGLAE